MTRDFLNIAAGVTATIAVDAVLTGSWPVWVPMGVAAIVLLHFGSQ